MSVPIKDGDSCNLFVWCVLAFDFAIWLPTFRFEFSLEFVFSSIYACIILKLETNYLLLLYCTQHNPFPLSQDTNEVVFILCKWDRIFFLSYIISFRIKIWYNWLIDCSDIILYMAYNIFFLKFPFLCYLYKIFFSF